MSNVIIHWSNGDKEVLKHVGPEVIENSKLWMKEKNTVTPFLLIKKTRHIINVNNPRLKPKACP